MTDMAEGNDENEFLTGFGMIKDMTPDELIEEILSHQRKILEEMDNVNQLRANVVELRVNDYKKRLAAEAGLVPTFMGLALPNNDEDNE